YDLYDGGKDNYEYNFRTAYIIDQWSPFVEVGNVSVNSNSDERSSPGTVMTPAPKRKAPRR
ncbi:oligogalacturonate-specific porin KdgM family protein, partial [Salmonella enterica subsp. enterica serovar Kentucky]|nr:oligogalacturonate-specific porin KdgM family protein [Salmonella enterica subsp. enterica serovar Kentucky]